MHTVVSSLNVVTIINNSQSYYETSLIGDKLGLHIEEFYLLYTWECKVKPYNNAWLTYLSH